MPVVGQRYKHKKLKANGVLGGEANKIEMVLEELEETISKSLGKITCVNDVNKITSKLMDVRKKAQNLVNALKVSNLKPKIDIKEECVDPVSIWKDVSELPRCLDGAAVFYKRDGQTFIGEAHSFGVIAIYPDSNSEHLNNEDIDKVCLVGDFIKSFEQVQKYFQELKSK